MDRDLGNFHSVRLSQGLLHERDNGFPSQSCFPLSIMNVSISQTHPVHLDQGADSSARLPISCSPVETFENSRGYFHSPSGVLPFSNYSCPRTLDGGTYSDLTTSSKVDAMLNNVVRTRRRKGGISDEERICIVCGEPASGYNFDRLTCESCKAFFRRNALKPKDKIKACSRGGGCVIEGNQRKHCPSCRLEKCFAVGMKRELILPPEKLEQRAKPRRRKHTSPQDDSCSPQNTLTAPSSAGSGNTCAQPPYLSSPLSTGSHPQHHPLAANTAPSSLATQHPLALNFPSYANMHLSDSLAQPSRTSDHNASAYHNPVSINVARGMDVKSTTPTMAIQERSSRLVPCRHTHGRSLCRHHRCRRSRWRCATKAVISSQQRDNHLISSTSTESEPDARLLSCLHECAQRIREPFTPDEQLETGVAVTLEQEYNRMDAFIRRIIRVVKLLPYFNETGKQAQLSLLRTNIYGLIVLYSSFFFERDIRKLRYPVLQSDGHISTVTVSMLDEVIAPNSNPNLACSHDGSHSDTPNLKSHPTSFNTEHRCATELREEFELYKVNTLAAFDHLDQLIASDDVLRVTVLAIKLFTDDGLPEDDLQMSVDSARQAYLLFLWSYLRWRAGPKRLRSATELYARLLIAFIDLRTLEIRMTEFAKLLSLDGLSPLMREVCSQRNTFGSVSA